MLTPELRVQIENFLRVNSGVFAWSHEDTLGINPEVITHRLNVNPNFEPAKKEGF